MNGWSPRVVLGASAMTVLLFSIMPLAHVLNRPDVASLILLRDVEAVTLPPPPAPPVFDAPPPVERAPDPVRVELPTPAPPAPTVPTPSMSFGLPSFGGDFQIAGDWSGWGIEDGVYSLAEIDAPPQPLVQTPPMYPPQARQSGLEGQVDLRFTVTVEGAVTDIEVVDSRPGAMFVPSARAAVERWRFEPAQRSGEPVAVRVEVPLQFRLDR